MEIWITFLGTAASVPSRARGTAATLVSRAGARVLIDCGEGTQRQLLRSGIGLVDVDRILLTHHHGDHILGLPGLIKTFSLRGRQTPLKIQGPAGLLRLFNTLGPLIGKTPFRLDIKEVQPGDVVWRDQGLSVHAFETQHRVPSVGFVFREDDRPGVFDPVKAEQLGVPPGPRFGELQRGATLQVDGRTVNPEDVMGPSRRGRVIVFTGDTSPCAQTVVAAEGADLLVHEATFLADDADRARETGHSTAAEAAQVAVHAGVRQLALTHLSSRYPPERVRAEARAVFPQVVVPRDFDQIEVPFPERSSPIYHPRADGKVAYTEGLPPSDDHATPDAG